VQLERFDGGVGQAHFEAVLARHAAPCQQYVVGLPGGRQTGHERECLQIVNPEHVSDQFCGPRALNGQVGLLGVPLKLDRAVVAVLHGLEVCEVRVDVGCVDDQALVVVGQPGDHKVVQDACVGVLQQECQPGAHVFGAQTREELLQHFPRAALGNLAHVRHVEH